MVSIFLLYLSVISFGFFLSISRFLNCLIILENYNVLILLFCLLLGNYDSHIAFVVLIVVSTVEIIIGLVVLTRVWECSNILELVTF